MTAMINPFTAPPRLDDAHLAWNTVASYDNYPQAQAAVDRLSDQGFPVEHIDIIGSDLEVASYPIVPGTGVSIGSASMNILVRL